MKKWLKMCSVCLTVAVTAGLFAGCGQESSNSDSSVKRVVVWSGETHSKLAYEKLVNEYNEGEGKEKGVYIDYQVKDNSTYNQTIELALQNGDAPDIFSGTMDKLVEENYIVAIDDLPGGPEYLEKYEGYLEEDRTSYNGKTYCVPVSMTTRGLIYNKDMFKAAGIVDENGEAKPPETWAELRETAKQLTNPEKKEYGIILPVKYSNWYGSDIGETLQTSVGFDGYNPVTGEYDYSGIIPIAQTYLDMKADGSVYPGAEGLDNDPARAQFAAGNIGMKLAYSFDVGVLTDQFPATCDWGVAPLPVTVEGERYKSHSYIGNSMFMNSKSVETIGGEALMEVFKFLTSDKVIQELYKEGINLPYDAKLAEGIEISGNPQWQAFADLIEQSVQPVTAPKTDATYTISENTEFVNKVWSGEETPEQFVERLEESKNQARASYYGLHPDEDINASVQPDWDAKISE